MAVFGALILCACDLQPKIASIPDNIGMFIEDRYPALLADPEKQPEIYNSAVTDYGVYTSPELYGTDNMDDYVLYASADDYVLMPVSNNESKVETEHETDYLIVPEYTENIDADETPVATEDKKIEEKEITGQAANINPDEIVVVRGDTVYALAKKYDISMAEFVKINNLKEPYTLKIGQKLTARTPVSKATDVVKNIVEEKKIETHPIVEQVKKVSEIKPAINNEITVVRGDTVYGLAKKHNIPVEDFVKINNLEKPYTLKIGQKLKISVPIVAKVEEPVDTKKENKKPVSVDKSKQVKPERVAEVKQVKKPTEVKRIDLTEITVKQGDTLYSLSRKYEIPVNDLAVINKISAPFTLADGQKLKVPKLDKKQTPQVSEVKKENNKTASVKTVKNVDKKSVEKKSVIKDKKTQTSQNLSYTKVEQKQQQNIKTKISSNPKQSLPKITARSSSKFSWPVRGTILSGYGPKKGGLVNDGINISASTGTVVKAAENGVVAYAGNEIKGMGNLVIIQHSDGWMTVYAHLNSMNVRRGARVSVGQSIGTVGKTGKVDKPQLHFEIRKGTRAYNPTQYLKK